MRFYGEKYWEDAFASRPWGKYPSEELIRFFLAARKVVAKPPRALDIGCGAGACAWFLARNGAQVTAIDGAPSALRQMERTLAEFDVRGVNAVLGDITAPRAFVSGSFDLLVDHYSLYANTEQSVRGALREYFQLLAPEGRFLACLFGKRCTGSDTGARVGDNTYRGLKSGPHAGTGTVSLWTTEEAEGLFSSSGFKVLHRETQLHDRPGVCIEKLVFHLGRQ